MKHIVHELTGWTLFGLAVLLAVLALGWASGELRGSPEEPPEPATYFTDIQGHPGP